MRDKNREFKQRCFWASRVNRKWTFCNFGPWFWSNCIADCLHQSIDTYQYKFCSFKAYVNNTYLIFKKKRKKGSLNSWRASLIREGGWGAVIQTLRKGGGEGSLQKTFFRPFESQFGLNIRGQAPRAPPLDLNNLLQHAWYDLGAPWIWTIYYNMHDMTLAPPGSEQSTTTCMIWPFVITNSLS